MRFSLTALLEILDILFVTLIIYQIFRRFQGSPVAQGFLGILFIVVAYIVSQWAGLTTTQWIMNHFLQNIFLILVILFQPEFRRLLSQFAVRRLMSGGTRSALLTTIEEVIKAVDALQKAGLGSLIIIERNASLGAVIETGTRLDALVSSPLLISLFHPASPLHDGAVVIAEERLVAAGCFLPIDPEVSLPPELGTRHRAALGISRESDALIIITSEEHRTISLVHDQILRFDLTTVELRSHLQSLLRVRARA